jgi:hypothetical protein
MSREQIQKCESRVTSHFVELENARGNLYGISCGMGVYKAFMNESDCLS